MRVLVDTHIFLWVVTSSAKLPATARELLKSAERVYLSSASLWELAIKARLGKLDYDFGELPSDLEAAGFFPLPVTFRHAAAVYRLPDIHRDPFDRMLIAQAITEPLRFVTADARLAAYSELVIPV